MANTGKIQLIYVIVAPPDQVEEGDRIFASHGPWMESTHPKDGFKALISYDVSKAPELSNPFDPDSEPTGNTVFVLNEIYETAAGVAGHFEQAMGSWADFEPLLAWLEKCSVTGVPTAPISNSLW